MTLLSGAVLIARKDMRIERRARVVGSQVIPFAGLILVLFAFALDPDRGVLERAAPGLLWVTVLLAALLVVNRIYGVETEGTLAAMRMSVFDGRSLFVGKCAAIYAQLMILELFLAFGVVVLYDMKIRNVILLGVVSLISTAGITASGVLYGMVARGVRAHDSLLPLLLLPALAPVLIASVRGTEAALAGNAGESMQWILVLALFAVLYGGFGTLSYDTLMEDQ